MKIQICLLINNYYLFDYKFILEHDEQLSSPSPQTPKSPKPKKGTGADTKISWATPSILSMKEWSHKKPQRVRKVQSCLPFLSSK